MTRQLWTTAQAAEHCGMAPATFRGAMTRLREAGTDLRAPQEQWPDRRTTMYRPDAVREWDSKRIRHTARTAQQTGTSRPRTTRTEHSHE